jgi:hypothetical protein
MPCIRAHCALVNFDWLCLWPNPAAPSQIRLFAFHVKHHNLFRGLDDLARYSTRSAILLQISLKLELFLSHLLGLLNAKVTRKKTESLVDR